MVEEILWGRYWVTERGKERKFPRLENGRFQDFGDDKSHSMSMEVNGLGGMKAVTFCHNF